jgi:hypothetical protein
MGSPNFSNPNPELLQSVEQLNAQKLAASQARSGLAAEEAANMKAAIDAQRELATGVIQGQVEAAMGNARLRSERRGAEVLSRGIELLEKFPAQDLNHLSELPIEGHRAIVRNLQEGEAAFEDLNHYHPDLAQQIAIAQPAAPSGPPAWIVDNPDGTFSVKLQTAKFSLASSRARTGKHFSKSQRAKCKAGATTNRKKPN